MGRMRKVPKWAGRGWGQSQTKAHSAGERRDCCRLVLNAYTAPKSSIQNSFSTIKLRYRLWISHIHWASLRISYPKLHLCSIDQDGLRPLTSMMWRTLDLGRQRCRDWRCAKKGWRQGWLKCHWENISKKNGRWIRKNRWWIIMMKFHSMFLKATYCLTMFDPLALSLGLVVTWEAISGAQWFGVLACYRCLRSRSNSRGFETSTGLAKGAAGT